MMDYANREIRQNKNSPYVATSLTSWTYLTYQVN
jgi:hypothetical protein